MSTSTRIKFYGTKWCPDCLRARRILDKQGFKYDSIDIDKDKQASQYVMEVNNGNRSVPTIIFPDGTILTEPSNPVLKEKLETLSS